MLEKDSLPLYSSQEVACHNSEDSCWIIIHERVLDVTYFNSHAGSWGLFLDVAGSDATEEFEAKCNPEQAAKLFDTYQVGWLDKESDYDPHEDNEPHFTSRIFAKITGH
uniref:Cytochrome b5 heme-binding domain-containing protein n=1 Tax=Vannella robusta TaxID=1487602 RepID=A0A7S4M3P3_9EUKA|mmetsp:Transcript_10512/g.12998  ORF Transcript_10512/g.12998 Transcript_10512/m.12998 type:complete len:109 (+) Transcript_10512:191-517(+)